MKRLVAAILISLVLSSCRSTIKQEKAVNPGTYKLKTNIKFNGLSRTYLLHIPEISESKPAPLVVLLHGAFSTAKQIEEQTGFSRLADQEEFYVAYPNGIGLFGKLQHWNAGHCCGKAVKDNIDDVHFIETILNDIQNNYAIDSNRIYLVGYSNGGMMAYRFAEEKTDRLSALAIVSGALNSTTDKKPTPWLPAAPSKPLPVIIMHGTNDEAVPISGGASPSKADGRIFSSMQDAADFWKNNNINEATVKTVELQDWGHAWPGPFFTSKESAPKPIQNYDAAPIIWSFFEQNGADL